MITIFLIKASTIPLMAISTKISQTSSKPIKIAHLKTKKKSLYKNFNSTKVQPNNKKMITPSILKNPFSSVIITTRLQHMKEIKITWAMIEKDSIPVSIANKIPLITKKKKELPKEKYQLTTKNFWDSCLKKTKEKNNFKKWKDKDNFLSMQRKPPDSKTFKHKINTSKEFLPRLETVSWMKEEKDFQMKEKAKESKGNNILKILMDQLLKVTVNLQRRMERRVIEKNKPKSSKTEVNIVQPILILNRKIQEATIFDNPFLAQYKRWKNIMKRIL